MNKVYRLIWNETVGAWVAVAEIARARGKPSRGGAARKRLRRLMLTPLALAVAGIGLVHAAPGATELPAGGKIVAGQARISQGNATMDINQTSGRAAIDWRSFNIGSAAQVNFHQPDASSVTLNRVQGGNTSQIFGKLNANGQVFLSNPNGVYFAPGASVDVGGLVATTHRISIDDFMAGKATFERDGATGSVINEGDLQARLGGYIALLAPEVRNTGVIVADMGTVALASGEAISLNFGESGSLAGVTATRSQIDALVENRHAVIAPGGLIILSAQAANQLRGGVVNNSGQLSANSLTSKGGRIYLAGGDIALAAEVLWLELKVARQKLEQRLGESQSIRQAVENVFQLFFKSRGRNLLLALLATAGFLFGIRRLRSFLADRAILSRRSDTFQFRVFSLVYSAFTVIGALLVFLVALYFFGDWVLLILMLLLILGVIWTSKQAIPRFWTQAVLILDMGVVREGERLVWNGLPWLVESISFYSTLSNPELLGGRIRLPIADIATLRSRPWEEPELWFPTQPGDVVLLPDGRPAEVELQSVEHVRLRVPGQGRVVMPAAQFAQQGIEKLSGGYRVEISFGLDYGDQARITTTMRETMREGVEARWLETRWSESFVDLAVEFKEAGASSLDYFVRVDLDGSQAFDYQAQRRALARFCVDVCNEQGWTIPFTQITLHMADTKSVPTDGPPEPTRKDPT